VRIALHLKGLAYDTLPVHLLRHGGEQFAPAFSALNPQSQVPVLLVDGAALTQSLALLEYLEERFPAPPLLPTDMLARAHVREIALAIACDIHPLNNLRVLRMLKSSLAPHDETRHDEIKQQWIVHWIQCGFAALETRLVNSAWRGQYCYGDAPTMADCCLVPQMFNARRFGIDLTPYPTLVAIEQAGLALAAFQQAAPGMQPDAE
jgi:maleylpyruvate isomerase